MITNFGQINVAKKKCSLIQSALILQMTESWFGCVGLVRFHSPIGRLVILLYAVALSYFAGDGAIASLSSLGA